MCDPMGLIPFIAQATGYVVLTAILIAFALYFVAFVFYGASGLRKGGW